MTDELEKQIEREQRELADAPPVPSAGLTLRCHFCGQLTTSGTLVETISDVDRLKGVCCGG